MFRLKAIRLLKILISSLNKNLKIGFIILSDSSLLKNARSLIMPLQLKITVYLRLVSIKNSEFYSKEKSMIFTFPQ